MTRRALVLVLAACAFAVPVHADAPTSPYAGQQARTIKALTPEMSRPCGTPRVWEWRRRRSLMGIPDPRTF